MAAFCGVRRQSLGGWLSNQAFEADRLADVQFLKDGGLDKSGAFNNVLVVNVGGCLNAGRYAAIKERLRVSKEFERRIKEAAH